MLTQAKSLTHEHLLSIINTESIRFSENQVIRILDAGCGNGDVISYLFENLHRLKSHLIFEIHGFDISDRGIDKITTFPGNVIKRLNDKFPEVTWEDRITAISVKDSWSYPDEYFDVIVSNQVGEHVDNHHLFFSEIQRTLKKGGFSAHIFPLKHYVYEGHLFIPFVHRIMNYEVLKGYIKLLSYLGFGMWKQAKKTGISIEEYAERQARYMHYFTNYLSYSEILSLAKENKLLISFRYTTELYSRKIRQLLHLKRNYEYRRKRSITNDYFALMVLRYLSSVTIFLEK